MGTETVMMTSRRKMMIKPLSAAVTLQCKEQNSTVDTNDHVFIQPPPTPAIIISPTSEKKRILIQDSVLPVVPTVQRNKVLLSYSGNNSLTDTDDSDSDDSTLSTERSQKSNKNLYYTIFIFSLWAAIQYWMITVAGFGAVFFAISVLFAIYFNTSKSDKKSNVLSAYSVFNPQCTPIQGSVDPKQLERELIFGGL